MNLSDLFARIHAHNMRRMWHYCIGAGIALSLLVGAGWVDGRNHRAEDRWTCWAERNDQLPEGVEIVAYSAPAGPHAKPGVLVECP